MRMSVDIDGAAERGATRIEAALPQSFTHDRRGGRSGAIELLGQKRAANDRTHAKRLEVPAADHLRLHTLGSMRIARDGHLVGAEYPELREHALLVAEHREFWNGPHDGVTAPGAARRVAAP